MTSIRPEDYYKAQLSATRHCDARERCPLAAICGAPTASGQAPLQPSDVSCHGEELFWANQPHEQHAFVIRSGLFVTMGRCSDDRDTPCGLLGRGDTAGMSELYADYAISDTYYLRALTDGRLCSFPARALRRHLEDLPAGDLARILSCALTNATGSSFALVRVLSTPTLYDRVVSLFVSLRELKRRESDGDDAEIGITHGDVALLVNANRSSVSRVLGKMEADGLIDLGYKSIRVRDAIDGHKHASDERGFIQLAPQVGR